ncbi:acyl--CoA ligase [bacterium]|nr:acyl--CoA ligase [bacterium]
MEKLLSPRTNVNSQLSGRITNALIQNRNKVILSDQSGSWTGAETETIMRTLEDYILNTSAPGTRVGIVMQNSAAKMMSILTVLKMGRVPAVFNAVESYAFLSKQKNITLLLCDAYIENNFKLPYPTTQINHEGKIIFEYSTRTIPSECCPNGTGLILFTSGSSGEPKGVFVPEEGLLYTIDYLIEYFGLNRSTKATVFLPTSHSMGLNTQFFPTFFAGGQSHLVNTSQNLSRIYRNLLASEGTFIGLIGDMLRICFEEKKRRNLPPATSVEHIQLAGGIIHRDHLRIAQELFPNAVIHKGYGMTEATRVSMINSNDPDFLNDTAGYVWPGQKVEVRSSTGKVLPPGKAGEIHIQGPNVTLGYDSPSAQRNSRGDFFASGDIGSFDHKGRLTIIGRSDSIFKINGERVSAKEIEQIALVANYCIRDVKCLPFDGPNIGRAKAVLFLEIPPELEESFLNEGKDLIETKLKERVSHNKYLPREILVLNKFPRTATGKLRSAALKEIYSDQFSEAPKFATGSTGFTFKRLNIEQTI